jgi:hypothetical protein
MVFMGHGVITIRTMRILYHAAAVVLLVAFREADLFLDRSDDDLPPAPASLSAKV